MIFMIFNKNMEEGLDHFSRLSERQKLLTSNILREIMAFFYSLTLSMLSYITAIFLKIVLRFLGFCWVRINSLLSLKFLMNSLLVLRV